MNRLFLTILAWLVVLSAGHAAVLDERIQAVGNARTDESRLVALGHLAKTPKLTPVQQGEVQRLTQEIQRYLTDDRLAYFSRTMLDTDDYDFGVAKDSPLFPLTYLYRGRMLVWVTMEYGGYWSNPEVRRERLDLVRGIFERAHRAFPEEPLARMYLGEPIPPEKTYAAAGDPPDWAIAAAQKGSSA